MKLFKENLKFTGTMFQILVFARKNTTDNSKDEKNQIQESGLKDFKIKHFENRKKLKTKIYQFVNI